ncbi:cache domain-containing protein, partial [Candidatus Sumerlaeota bacterium]|nr:cache domain-containing protein [Candidatus Sumerlaeota bacterium]
IRHLLGDGFARTDFSQPRGSAYRRLWALLVGVTLAFSIIPLTIMTVATYSHYAEAFRPEVQADIERLTWNTGCALNGFVHQSIQGLMLIITEKTLAELSDEAEMTRVLHNLRQSFGSYVDLGLIHSDGVQRSYVGPYDLKGKNYADQDWFHEITIRRAYFSDVFIGFRNIPHFAVAVKHETEDGRFYVLRATFDTEALTQQISPLRIGAATDVFITNRKGVLQTPHGWGGTSSIPVPLLALPIR